MGEKTTYFEYGFVVKLMILTIIIISGYIVLSFTFSTSPHLLIISPLFIINVAGLILIRKKDLFKIKTRYIGVYLGIVFLTVIYLIYYTGNVYSPHLAWLIIPAFFSFLLGGKRISIIFLVLTIVFIGVLLISSGEKLFYENQKPFITQWHVISVFTLLISIVLPMHWFFNKLINQKNKIFSQFTLLQEKSIQIEFQNKVIDDQLRKINIQNVNLHDKHIDLEAAKEMLNYQIAKIENTKSRLERFTGTLLILSKNEAVHNGNLNELWQLISRVIKRNLNINRVSFWEYNERKKKLSSLYLSDQDHNESYEKIELNENDFPEYFKALKDEKLIVVEDVYESEVTRSLLVSYMIPNEIKSMLDSPFFIDNALGGVICCENAKTRIWQPEERFFVNALSDLISVAYKAKQRDIYQKELLKKKREIEELNEELEEKVRQRTVELEELNHQLMDYAFLNSHVIRGPVCRVVGLNNVLNMSDDEAEKKYLISQIIQTVKEIDEVTHKASTILTNGTVSEFLENKRKPQFK
ncbi:GAF domain-containing protein [Mangrovivirga sp. M17]|uniref:GAF domain-containing protein n=1 Tax=Mangrovivirga halotolerans TaxID=2993936 RepID=A0ABT3RR05_9BACT|nr:GAF domain-containing protein [Mangrovivirga halotolerans]MCX2743931.1 GAF domain-containing protein [Mangrovivirga halotolerans]